MGDSLVLQVSGIPINLLYKMVRDKLLIHFLRRSNGGDGEVDVRYPTEEEGMATLTFGHKEVANRVLSRRHHLKIEGITYLLEVIRLQCWGTQVSNPLMALSLDEDEGSDSNGRPGYRSDGFSQRRPNNTSTEDSTAMKKHPKSNMAANLNFHPRPTKKIPTDEDRRPGRNSPPASNEKPADSSGLPRHTAFARTQFREDLPESGQLKDTFAADSDSRQRKPKGNIADGFTSNPKLPIGDGSDFNPGQPKNTSTDELNSNPKHSKSTIRDSAKFNSGQPKGTFTDELGLNPKHSRSAIGDSAKFNPGQPKNTSTDELNWNPKFPKNHLGDLKPSNPQNSSPDEFLLNPRTREDLTASSPIRSSLMAAGWSSSSSSTANSSTANHLDQNPLSTDFLVDPAAHTYVSVFMKDEINNILGQSDVEMKTETGDGFSRVILTTKPPHLSQNFYKAAHEISDIFMKCQGFLRVESIELSNISSDVTKKLQLYLLRCGIWSSPNGKRLQMIGPYEGIVGFMKKWTSAGGDFAGFGQLLQEEASSASSRPPVVGMDNIHQSTAQDHNVTHDVHTQRARPRERGEEPGARGGSRGPDTTK